MCSVRATRVVSATSSWVCRCFFSGGPSIDLDTQLISPFYSEFDFRTVGDGRSATARYANNSNYRNDSLIRKESMCKASTRWWKTGHYLLRLLTCRR